MKMGMFTLFGRLQEFFSLFVAQVPDTPLRLLESPYFAYWVGFHPFPFTLCKCAGVAYDGKVPVDGTWGFISCKFVPDFDQDSRTQATEFQVP